VTGVVRFGERALLFEVEPREGEDLARTTLGAAARVRETLPHADVVSGAGALLVAGAQGGMDMMNATRAITRASAADAPVGRAHTIDVAYDGPDLDDVAKARGLTREAVIERHAGAEYRAEIAGFLPGFCYLGGLDPRLEMPRRSSPRPAVSASSVGIADLRTGIYPFRSPGGWRLLGRARATMFDPSREQPSLIAPGDTVRFSPIDPFSALEPVELAAPEARGAALVVVTAPACATIQDRGRPGLLGKGLPASGALDPSGLEAANRAVGNAPHEAAIEVPLGALEVIARGRVTISIDGEPALTLAEGDRVIVAAGSAAAPAPAVRYLAVAGGVDVPEVLGARATLLVARLGGFAGRALRPGDVVPVGDRVGATTPFERDKPLSKLPIDEGPHKHLFNEAAMNVLFDKTWTIARHVDRVGARLEGHEVPTEVEGLAQPTPMVRGAIQITPDGTPIILGPDHPTTGGYPVIAVLTLASQRALARLAPGDKVRFCET
jgi:KipI family sensor histidine kinase inhibitor